MSPAVRIRELESLLFRLVDPEACAVNLPHGSTIRYAEHENADEIRATRAEWEREYLELTGVPYERPE